MSLLTSYKQVSRRMSALKVVVVMLLVLGTSSAKATHILISMDTEQKNHLKAYGIAYWTLTKGIEVEWLLNYRGGCFMMQHVPSIESECVIRGVSYSIIADAQAQSIRNEIASPEVNQDIMKLEKPPKIAVYSPKDKRPWDDAVTLVMTYAEIPYEVVFDDELLEGKLPQYDWLHLHHEDFTGQYGKFYMAYHNFPWYQQQVREYETRAAKYGFRKVSQMKLAVVKKIQEYVLGGGFLFAMCSATDTYDIALAAEGIDICAPIYDGDGADPQANRKLNYDPCFAFQKFRQVEDPLQYEYSDIDNQVFERAGIREANDYFQLFQFSAKWDPIPTMLTQNHETTIKGFMGQTTAFKARVVKPEVVVMGEMKAINEVRYMHGKVGKGTFTFYGGHDPEDYEHRVGEEPTDLNLHPNSPGYRLILNNILFPAAKKKKQKT